MQGPLRWLLWWVWPQVGSNGVMGSRVAARTHVKAYATPTRAGRLVSGAGDARWPCNKCASAHLH
eukprot:799757-Pyramimonas_sp.AAC.1